ncbi:MAG: isoprenylcysteine carboxylmethyltransferase family protein [Methanomassiliicoccales archaeon]|jgi:protein-S-isoprenylcysteine O-methyltransferase Ste14|nr:isoprenylcysteine carboxylmethyltransferase family protein [Methanomassiliicoccales archaeon]MDD1756933.1 isoprenylcysteine carboxylmethyltransferase family protein [Methanomassiliicoccales archaeon]
MNISVFSLIYVICAAASLYIRVFFMMGIEEREVGKSSPLDRFLVVMIAVSMVIPLAYILTPWVDFANYHLPDQLAWIGAALMVLSVYLLWRSHSDLGTNFALTPHIAGEHTLVRNGVYRRIRHPMYASLWLYAFATPLLIQNAIVGLIFLAVFAVFYFVRVPQEEKMMREKFGSEYHTYSLETGRCLPKFR